MIKVSKNEAKQMSLLRYFKDNGILIRARVYDPNPNKEIDINGFKCIDKHDCSTRAMCKILNKPYEDVFKEQLRLSAKYYMAFNHMGIMNEIMTSYGYEYHKLDDSVLFLEFMMTHPKGRYLLLGKGHSIAYINGTAWDNFNKKCIDSDFRKIAMIKLFGWFEKVR